jgi:hypothetical protein
MMRQTGLFPWSDSELDLRVCAAIRTMWATREAQGLKQLKAGTPDAGDRGMVTGGRHLDGFTELLATLAGHAGFVAEEIRLRRGVEVPGFYRPTKKWDLVVTRGDRLCAAIELKSMSGSYGKNLNNRTEEALGSATDIWAAYKKGTLGLHQPWLGYIFIVREEQRSMLPVKVPMTPMAVDPAFKGTSYIDRYGILCERMVLERVYTAAAYLSSPLENQGSYREPHSQLGFSQFAKAFFGHLIGCV